MPRSIRSMPLALAATLLAAPPAGALVTVDYDAMGSFTVVSGFYSNCGIIARSPVDEDLHFNDPADGIAIAGGDATAIDGDEFASFRFNDNGAAQLATQVSVEVAVAGGAGAFSVTAFDAAELPIGTAQFSGPGWHSLSATAGSEPISYFELRPDPDPVRVLAVSFEPAPSSTMRARFWWIGSFTAAETSLCGVTLSGSATLNIEHSGGVAVIGGAYDNMVEQGESLLVELDAPSLAVSHAPWSGVGTVRYSIEGFDPGGQSLGVVPQELVYTPLEVNALFGGVALGAYRVVAGSQLADGGHSLGEVVYEVPEPAGVALGAAAALSLAGLRRSRRA